VLKLQRELQNSEIADETDRISLQLVAEALKIPNDTHPEPFKYDQNPVEVRFCGEKPSFSFKPKEFSELTDKINILHHKRLTPYCGNRSYFLLDGLSELEHALVRYAIDSIRKKGFQLVSVPDLLHHKIIESCGMDTKGPRNQVSQIVHFFALTPL